MIPTERLDRILTRKRALEARLGAPAALGPNDYARDSKEYAEILPIADKAEALRALGAEVEELEGLARDPGSEPDMRSLAQSELAAARVRIQALEDELRLLLLPKDAADDKNVILELRAGTGGGEAALFAGDLFRMYERYAELKGWKIEVLAASLGTAGGYKEVIAAVSGRGVFARLKYESGVHRVQRVPETESSGRIHTSAATVAVLPEPEEVEVAIDEKDLKIDVFRSSGPGGQSVNTTDSAVRITHIPSGIVVSQQDEKSQHKNRAKAMKVLRARLFEHERARAADERATARRGQVGTGDRSERIRTYNFPQGRVTDHRIGLTLYKLGQILEGEALDELVDAITAEDKAAQLAEFDRTAADGGGTG